MSTERESTGYEMVIGLEIHAQLNTATKLFCTDSTEFGAGDNQNTCPVCLGMPGCLPVLNEAAVELSIRTGLALNCKINSHSVFARKQYFYPDLPKGYQISQFDKPLCSEGFVEFVLEGERKRVRIERAHMEEDAGKSTHHGEYSLININRAGIPLLEIVSAPDMKSPQEAAEYARSVRQILRYLEVCDGNLEEGSLRCDCNVSIRKIGESKLGTKVEIKNINSFRFVEKAVEFEFQRQVDCMRSGEKILQETRLYDPDKNRTFSMRSKEEAHDYRYFPEPDLLPLQLKENEIEEQRRILPELPLQKANRFINEFGLPEYDAFVLTAERALSEYFEKTAELSKNPKAASNFIMTEVMRELNQAGLQVGDSKVSAQNLAELISLIDSGKISGKMAKQVFMDMWTTQKSAPQIVSEKGMGQISDKSAIEGIVDDIIKANSAQVEQYRSGKDKLFGFFVGQAMKASKGQANPEMLTELLKTKLKAP